MKEVQTMIELPRNFLTSAIATPKKARGQTVHFEAIAEEEQPPIIAVERRRTPSRRKPTAQQETKSQIERRVSHDRRRTTFSSKA